MIRRTVAILTLILAATALTAPPAVADAGSRERGQTVECPWPCGWANVTATAWWNSNHHATQVRLSLDGGHTWVQSNPALYSVHATIYAGDGSVRWDRSGSFAKSELPKYWWPEYAGTNGWLRVTGWVGFDNAPDAPFDVWTQIG